jgi:hypothetical protein
MFRTVLFAAFVVALMPAAAAAGPADRIAQASSSDVSSQARRARPQTRLRVYPGRLLYRDCDFRLVQQYRPSGPVIVPWQRCWWVRG